MQHERLDWILDQENRINKKKKKKLVKYVIKF